MSLEGLLLQGLIHGGTYFRNFTLFYSNTGLVLDLQWLLYSNIRTMKSIYGTWKVLLL